jgi:hypothetical protein
VVDEWRETLTEVDQGSEERDSTFHMPLMLKSLQKSQMNSCSYVPS